MQISKTFLLACTMTCCAGSISLVAADSPSQAQAREALRKRIAELNAQEPGTKTPAQKAPSAEQKAAPAPTFQPVAQQPPATVTPATTPIVSSSPEETARQREAVRQKLAELSAQETAAPTAKPPGKKSGAVTKVTPPTFAPLETPPSAVPATKEAKLADLLRKYKADDITPEDYHKARARILAEP